MGTVGDRPAEVIYENEPVPLVPLVAEERRARYPLIVILGLVLAAVLIYFAF